MLGKLALRGSVEPGGNVPSRMASAIDVAICSSRRCRSGGENGVDWFIGSTNIVDATMNDELRSAAAPRWRGQPGRLEVWYATLSDPVTRAGCGCITKSWHLPADPHTGTAGRPGFRPTARRAPSGSDRSR
ncbi:hypothetical protein I553_2203 [Mycobacterium xenopi 4042]|uniref:Uncharacterized protein n=1 Tax=Mycobacterium xenopi 4042 TaxID=1299334 RepID=X8DNG3_MYCXE|nr:hypothetical protein I553_2203 [Mycobacterium xenopi 4042]